MGWALLLLLLLPSLRALLSALPPGFKCPICSKSVASDEMEMHFIMCLSKPRLSYNGKGAGTLWAGERDARAGWGCGLAKRAALQLPSTAHRPCLVLAAFPWGPFVTCPCPRVAHCAVPCRRDPSQAYILPHKGRAHGGGFLERRQNPARWETRVGRTRCGPSRGTRSHRCPLFPDDVLTKDAGECVICLEELLQGDTIARLPCLCIYHKRYGEGAAYLL